MPKTIACNEIVILLINGDSCFIILSLRCHGTCDGSESTRTYKVFVSLM